MKKFFNVEMRANDPDADALRAFCKRNGIYYEASDCGNTYEKKGDQKW